MRLPWRDVAIDGGRPISTSLTAAEAAMLSRLAAGRVVLEIGSAYGYSTIVMAKVAEQVIAVDPHEGHGALPGSLERMRANLAAYHAGNVTMVLEPSAWALRALGAAGARFGLVFIDGDHRADALAADLLGARALLSPSGQFAVHDHGEDTCPDVAPVLDAFSPGQVTDTLWTC